MILGLPLANEERSVGFSVVVEEDFPDESGTCERRALYRVILSGEAARYAQAHLKVGTSVLVRGELFSNYPSIGDPAWNHRVVFGEEVLVLAGELSIGRAYPIDDEAPVLLNRAVA